MIRPRLVLAAAMVASAAPPVGAQAVHEPPPRPRLAASADTNDWGAYFDRGVDALQTRSGDYRAAFWWAARLGPDRAEPLFAQWVAIHMSDYHRWLGYLRGEPAILEHPAVRAADSVRLRARYRNPLVGQTLEVLLFDQLPGSWARTDLTDGWLAFARGEHRRAARLLGEGIRADPTRHAFAREARAQVLVALEQYDSALVEMRELRAALERREAQVTYPVYQSRELVDYSIGFLESARGNPAAAREAMERALTENLAFHPAHVFLGDQAFRASDAPRAIYHYEEALVVDSADVVLLHHYAVALMHAGRIAEAVAALRRAVALEPWYAEPWLPLGRALQAQKSLPAARDAYNRYLALARRKDAKGVRDVRARVAAIEAQLAATPR